MRSFCRRAVGIGLVAIALSAWIGIAVQTGIALGAEEPSTAATSAAGGSEAKAPEPEGHPDPLQFKSDLAIWTFCVFVILFVVLKKFAWGPISQSLEKREHHIAENIAAAQRAQDDAKSMLAEYERKLASAADEVRAMLEEARRDAEGVKQQIVAEAKSAAQAEHQRAMHDIRTATDAAVEQLSEKSADLAVALAGKIISAKLTSEERSKLVQESLGKFAAAAPSKN